MYSEQITETKRLLHNLVAVGTVLEVDAAQGRMRLSIGDNETDWVSIPAMASGALKVWRCPTLGEQFVIVNQSGNLGNAIALAALPSDDNPNPSSNADEIVFDMPAGRFVVNQATGKANLSLNELTLDIANININGDISQNGKLTASDDVVASGISLKTHTHTGVESGTKTTGLPL